MNPETTTPTKNRWQISQSLARSAWNTLKLDRKLVGIPVISTGLTIALAFIVGLIIALTSTFENGLSEAFISGPLLSLSWVSLLFYFGLYILFTFIGTYFSAALIAGLLMRFRGEVPTVSSAMAAARKNIGSLFMFSFLAGTLGYILQVIEDRVPLAGQIAALIVGAAWSVASMFALPVIVTSREKIGPIAATKQSFGIIKKTWGETAILSVGIGLVAAISVITFIITMAAIGTLVGYIVSSTQASSLITGISLGAVGFVGVVGILGMALLFTMLSAVVKTAIYHYATTGEVPESFEKDILRASFTQKKARGVFGA